MSRSGLAFATATAAAVVVAGGIGIAAVVNGRESEPIATNSSPTESAALAPTPARTKPDERPTDPLTGGEVSENEVIAVKVENIAAARPQVGLNQADITFVQEVEGAQTRLIAVYHSRFPKRVGPIRSARSTDVQLLPLFGKPGLVYSGANPSVQRKIDNASRRLVPVLWRFIGTGGGSKDAGNGPRRGRRFASATSRAFGSPSSPVRPGLHSLASVLHRECGAYVRRPGGWLARPTREAYRVVFRPRRTPRGACLGGANRKET